MNREALAIPNVTKIEATPWDGVKVPDGFSLSSDGVFECISDKPPQRLCGPLWVVAKTRDGQGCGWGLVASWVDQDGNVHEQSFPMKVLYEARNSSLIQALSDRGLMIVPNKATALLGYLAKFNTDARRSAVYQTGWHCDAEGQLAFVLPDQIIRVAEGEELVFQPDSVSHSDLAITSEGDVEQWKIHIASKVTGNPILIFGLGAAFAAPLLNFLKLDCSGFHFFGMSSQGKTTALQVAGTVWGNGIDPASNGVTPPFIERWNSTVNAFEATAANHNDLLLALDEMATCDAKDFGRVVYNLAGGQGKARMSKDGELKGRRQWRAIVLSSGEVSVKNKIEEAGAKAKAGQLNRLIDIPVTGKIIADSHGDSPSNFATSLKRDCAKYYGVAGPAFIEGLLSKGLSFESMGAWLSQRYQACIKQLMPSMPLPSDAERAIQRFAVVLLASELAIEFGLLFQSKEEVLSANKTVRDAWLSRFVDHSMRGIFAVRDFIARYNESKFWNIERDIEEGPMIHDAAGYKDPRQGLFIFHDEAFERACGGLDGKEVAKALRENDLLFKNDNKLKSRHTLPDTPGRPWRYAVKNQILNFEVSMETAGTAGQSH